MFSWSRGMSPPSRHPESFAYSSLRSTSILPMRIATLEVGSLKVLERGLVSFLARQRQFPRLAFASSRRHA